MMTSVVSLPPRVDLVVLGGGPAGLAAAWEASLADKSVLVVEREPVLGGLCATVEREGFRFDLGGHRIVSKRATLVERVRELLGPALEERSRKSVIWLDGQRFSYPLVAGELVRQLPLKTLAQASADYAKEWAVGALHRSPREDGHFEHWVVRRFGRTLYDLFFGPYTEKLWGIPATQLSADWAAQRISLLNLADVAARLSGIRHGGARTYARRYLYPTGGIGVLFERLAALLKSRGVWFVTGTVARKFSLNSQTNRVTAVELFDQKQSATVACDGVVSTVPLGALSELLQPGDQQVQAISRGMRHRGMRFLNVMINRPGPMLNATWMYVSDPKLPMTRVQEPAERSPSMTPAGYSSLMIEFPCDRGDWISQMDDESLLKITIPSMKLLGIHCAMTDVRDVFSSYAPYAYPMYSLTYRSGRDALLNTVDTWRNVWSVGRQGLFRYVFMDTAMEMGFAAAREFIRGEPANSARMLNIDNNPTLHEVQSVTA